LSSSEAYFAARVAGVPAVALNTFAGVGGLEGAIQWCLQDEKTSWEQLDQQLRSFNPNVAAVDALNIKYGNLNINYGLPEVPFYLDSVGSAALTLTTTIAELEDPLSLELADAYAVAGARLVPVGPLLGATGTWRAHGKERNVATGVTSPNNVLKQVLAAREVGRRVVFVSMGTVVTGDMPYWGWSGRTVDRSGQEYGLTGKELCHAAWSGAFDAFGAERTEEGPLIVVAVGQQPDALDGLSVPPNVVCAPAVPQVDILDSGVDVFLTHGGQNSFMEAIMHATPLLVCPGFSDQVVNSKKS